MSGRHGDDGSVTSDGNSDSCASTEQSLADVSLWRAALATINGSVEKRRLHCRGDRLNRHGKGRTGTQRWRCRDCGRTFCSTTGTMLAGLHAPGKLGIVVADMLSSEPASCRRLASALQLSKMTIWAWRQMVSRAFAAVELIAGKDGENAGIHRAAQSASTVLREFRKASREWVHHQRDPARYPAPDRLRWVDYRVYDLPLPQPMAPHLVTVGLGANGRSRHQCAAMPLAAGTRRIISSNVDMPPGYARSGAGWARSIDLLRGHRASGKHGDTRARAAGELGCRLSSSEIVDRFQSFLGAFSGPATKHLGNYLAWFDARRHASDDGRKRRVWLATLDALATRSPTRSWDMCNLAGAGWQQRGAAA